MSKKAKNNFDFVKTRQDPTVRQAADYFQCTTESIRQMIADGLLEAYNLGVRGTRVKLESIERIRDGEAA